MSYFKRSQIDGLLSIDLDHMRQKQDDHDWKTAEKIMAKKSWRLSNKRDL